MHEHQQLLETPTSVYKYLKELKLVTESQKLFEKDSILIFYFFTRMVEETDKWLLSEN